MASPSSSRSLYEPLPPGYIRVLELEGTCLASGDDDLTPDLAIKCSLRPLKLSDAEASTDTFVALSYVWGTRASPRPVICNGHKVSCTQNLHDVLHRLAIGKIHRQRAIWADAICIDQSDDDDKSQQISLMTKIYLKAEQVLIWLGSGSYSAGADLDRFWAYLSGLNEDGNVALSSRLDQNAWKAGVQFLRDSDWFKRVWTFQEVVLAQNPTILCSSWAVSWNRLASSMRQIKSLTEGLDRIEQSRKQYNPPGMRLADAARLTVDRVCENPRDKIYGLLGICLSDPLLSADYRVNTVQVYGNAAATIVRQGGLDDVLALLDLPDRNGFTQFQRFPIGPAMSWIPDFANLTPGSYQTGSRPPASKYAGFDYAYSFHGTDLKIHGIAFRLVIEPESDDSRILTEFIPPCMEDLEYKNDGWIDKKISTIGANSENALPRENGSQNFLKGLRQHRIRTCSCKGYFSSISEKPGVLSVLCILADVSTPLMLRLGFDDSDKMTKWALVGKAPVECRCKNCWLSKRPFPYCFSSAQGCLVKFEIAGDVKEWRPIGLQDEKVADPMG